MDESSGHVVLLGDSVLDNGAYVLPGQPDVVAQVRAELGPRRDATLLAVDGAVTSDVLRQLGRVPPRATHLVVSVGGNDALGWASSLDQPARSVGDGVEVLARAQEGLASDYAGLVDRLTALGLPTALCTVYDTRLTEPPPRLVRAGLALVNDVVTRAAARAGLDVLDLRVVCDEDADYANPIEPSAHGGRRIARAVARWVLAEGAAARVVT